MIPIWIRQLHTEPFSKSQEIPYTLTRTETRVAALTFQGKNIKEIAEITGMPPQCVKNCRSRIYNKFGCSDTIEMVNMAIAQSALQLWLYDPEGKEWAPRRRTRTGKRSYQAP